MKPTKRILRWLCAVLSPVVMAGMGNLLRAQPSPPNFFNFVVIGDSISAGVRGNGFNSDTQQSAYTALLARQIGTFLFEPLIDPRFVPELQLVDRSFPPTVRAGRADPTVSPRIAPFIFSTNLAVPGHKLVDVISRVPNPAVPDLNLLVLGIPALSSPIGARTQLQMAALFRPSFTVLWIGNNDVLDAALSANPDRMTDFTAFQQQFNSLIGALRLLGTKLVVANIPDVTAVPALTSARKLADYFGRPLSEIGPLLGISDGDFVTAVGLTRVVDILSGRAQGPLPQSMVLTAAKVEAVRNRTRQFNGFIAQLSQAFDDFRFPVVDVFSLFGDIVANGLNVGGVRLTADFLGGLFSLDGVHPSMTGHAIIANAFIDTINNFYGTSIPKLSEAEILATVANDPTAPARTKAGDAPLDVLAMDEETYQAMYDLVIEGRWTHF